MISINHCPLSIEQKKSKKNRDFAIMIIVKNHSLLAPLPNILASFYSILCHSPGQYSTILQFNIIPFSWSIFCHSNGQYRAVHGHIFYSPPDHIFFPLLANIVPSLTNILPSLWTLLYHPHVHCCAMFLFSILHLVYSPILDSAFIPSPAKYSTISQPSLSVVNQTSC